MKTALSRVLCLGAVSLAWISGAEAFAAQAGDAPMLPVPIVRLIAAFTICALAALAAAVALKIWLRRNAGASSSNMFSFTRKAPTALSVLETRQLSPNALVTRIAYDNLEFLVLVSGHGASVLHQKPIAPQNAS